MSGSPDAVGVPAGTKPLGRIWSVPLAYVVITIAMTWPLAAHPGRAVASDMGDPLLNCWILAWTSGQVIAAATGHLDALRDYWNGNIFYPDRWTLAYSEHLTPQMAQALPIYAATGNVVLSYNVVFLLTFVVSALAVWWLVRDLTGRSDAAFVAGLAYAFAPYRLTQLSHLQVLSSFWMPLALVGLRRFFATGSRTALAGGAASTALQGLSCGYFLVYFTPFAALYALYEMASRGLLRAWRVWTSLAIAAAAVAIVLWPFVTPYLEVRAAGVLTTRSLDDVMQFSVDTRSFAAAPGQSRLLGGRLGTWPSAEAQAFPGFTILALAGVGLAWGAARALRQASSTGVTAVESAIAIAVSAALLIDLALLAAVLIDGQVSVLGIDFRGTDRFTGAAAVLVAALLLVSPSARRAIRGAPESAWGFIVAMTIAAAWLALGPRIQVAGHPVGTGTYAWLYAHVPGFDGLRVPARYLMIVSLGLAVLAGYAVAAASARSLLSRALVVAGSVLMLAEWWTGPFPIGVPMTPGGFAPPPHDVATSARTSPLYRIVHDAPGRQVLIEFPFGEPAYDLRAVFYAGQHRRPIVNGYSGFYPPRYAELMADLGRVPPDRDAGAATRALASSGATFALVHEAAFLNDRGRMVSDWLRSTGATLVATDGGDMLFRLR